MPAANQNAPTRQQERREATVNEIKRRSREQIARNGPGALSLRAVARDMRVSSAAIYRYFPSHADVITTLCIDTYNDLADTVNATRGATEKQQPAERMWAVFESVRTWALTHPSDFTLIFGTPIPGYKAPEEETTAAAARLASSIVKTYAEAAAAGVVDLAVVEVPKQNTQGDLGSRLTAEQPSAPAEISAGALFGWTSVIGFISTELWGNLGRIVTTTDSAFDAYLRSVLRTMGFHPEALPDA
ncbi:MAG: TetR/AcrR family transcriptional regulator [Actinomycetota bacterium]|nr:TetR/AcrR family transcriptional regulator [Actinomycetota bacterium]